MPTPLDFFIHVPKTGGTTMSQIIASQYPRGTALIFGKTDYERRAERIATLEPGVRIVSGHLHYGWAKRFPRPCRSLTILRDPIERVISAWFYIAREPLHRLHEEVRSGRMTMEDLARRQSGIQIKYIAGYEPKDKVPADVLLAEARENLVHRLVAFGLTERFDETLLIFNQEIGWKVRGYARANVTRNRPQKEAITDKDLHAIRAHYSIDIAFYEFARELFEKRLAAQPRQFHRQLAALRRNVKIAQFADRIWKHLARFKRAAGTGT